MRDNFTPDEATASRAAHRVKLAMAVRDVVEIHDAAFRNEPWFAAAKTLNEKLRGASVS